MLYEVHTKSLYWVLVALLLLCTLFSLAVGSMDITTCLYNPPVCKIVLQELRIPRTLTAAIGGASLGLTGAVLQGFLRNPLADAGIIGIASGAAFGATLFISLGLASVSLYMVPIGGLIGSAIIVLLLLGVGRWFYQNTTHTILGGIVLNSLFGALTILTLNLSQNPYAHLEAIFWLLGSFAQHTYGQLSGLFAFSLLGWYILWKERAALDAFSFGEEMAYTLGFESRKIYKSIVWGVSLCIGPLVSLVGVIGFIGLVVPHILRPFVRHKPSNLLLPSALGGACLAILADTFTRLLPTTMEMKVGVITSLIGAPIFIYILIQSGKKRHDIF